MQKPFIVAQIKDLLNQLLAEEITLSRFVEILNEQAAPELEKCINREEMVTFVPTGEMCPKCHW